MKVIIENEVRNKEGAYKTPEIAAIGNDIDKMVKAIFKKHSGKLSEDSLCQLIQSSAWNISIYNIAMGINCE